MIEREKQKADQEKKRASKPAGQEQKAQEQERNEQTQAGMATDPEAMKDPGYAQRIDEKTSKH